MDPNVSDPKPITFLLGLDYDTKLLGNRSFDHNSHSPDFFYDLIDEETRWFQPNAWFRKAKAETKI